MGLLEQIKNKGLVLDGAMSYELEKQGVDTNNKLWTATALIDQLSKVYQAHWDYFEAGADLVITDTYQANIQAYTKAGYTEQEGQKFIANAVKIAKKARANFEKKTGKHNYVAGTIGSYGAYLADGNEYRGEYDLSKNDYLNFHLPRLKAVLNEEPDLLAIETQPKLDEPTVLLNWLKENESNVPVYVSFTLEDTNHISDGTPIEKVAKVISQYKQVIAVGINCVKPDLVTSALTNFARSSNLPLVVYPNLGAVYDPEIKQWKEFTEEYDFSKLADEWYKTGARLIGGCCTTGPKQIKEISTYFAKL